ncbi:MAG: bifunctional diaminohydroxyphosphoribosylaminopyrimidine deaminase/5-amino-6-(5-phosphoribosylamino)uracil reductase RibD [Flavobacterium sp.]|jgi:diaminohydroxyphosphoribosylaminopyrimidine deaminase/5-amino-6-(5-phosphoribosylamino)uracil reductase
MNHEFYIKRCLEIASKGLGSTYPNPLVGAVLVHDNHIIGEGWHLSSGKPHAEVNAINNVKKKELIPYSTLYVSLEPCSHFGKTPPCSLLIIEKKIKKVVVGTLDNNPMVAGKGIEILQKNGIEVIVGICENECKAINKRFFTFLDKKRPYVILKWAKSKDNYISPSSKNDKSPYWISNYYSRVLSHKWRTEEQAILVGTNTVLDDNPILNSRLWKGNNPVRIVMDKNNVIQENFNIKNDFADTIIFTQKVKENTKNISYIFFSDQDNLCEVILETLYKKGIQSVIIEGGSFTLQQFINQNLWDEARIFQGSSNLISGTISPTISGKIISNQLIKNDQLTILRNDKN